MLPGEKICRIIGQWLHSQGGARTKSVVLTSQPHQLLKWRPRMHQKRRPCGAVAADNHKQEQALAELQAAAIPAPPNHGAMMFNLRADIVGAMVAPSRASQASACIDGSTLRVWSVRRTISPRWKKCSATFPPLAVDPGAASSLVSPTRPRSSGLIIDGGRDSQL
jgi:hypothetical protein